MAKRTYENELDDARPRTRICMPPAHENDPIGKAIRYACSVTMREEGRVTRSRRPIILFHITVFGDACGMAYWPRNIEVGASVMSLLCNRHTRDDALDVMKAFAYDDWDEVTEKTLSTLFRMKHHNEMGCVKEYRIGSENNRTGCVQRDQLDTFLYFHIMNDLIDDDTPSSSSSNEYSDEDNEIV
jgi:hypothetical protein